jgi:AAA domain
VLPGIDTRTGQGYIHAAPTIHKVGGADTYRWDVAGVIPPIPFDLLKLLPRTTGDEIDATVHDLLGGGFILPDVIPDGQRHDIVYRYACSMRARGFTITQAVKAMRDILPRIEKSDRRPYELSDAIHELDQAWSLPAPALSQVASSRSEPSGLEAHADDPEGAEDATSELVDWSTVWSSDTVAIDWIVPGLIEAGRGYLVYSKPKAGKSLLTLDWVARIAQGIAVVDDEPARPRRVLYLDYENALQDVVGRLKSMGYEPGELESLMYAHYPAMRPFDTQIGGAELMALIEDTSPELVVFDTASRTIEGNENDSETWLRWYRHTGLPMKRRGVAWIRLDHSGKDITRSARGSSAKTSDVDAVWRLQAKDQQRIELRLEERRQLGLSERVEIWRGDNADFSFGHRIVAADEATAKTQQTRFDEFDKVLLDHGVSRSAGRPRVQEVLREVLGTGIKNGTCNELIKYRQELEKLSPGHGDSSDARSG